MTGTRRDKVAKWTTLIGSIGAVLGVAFNGYQSIQEKNDRTRQDAYQRAQLDKSWELLRDALNRLNDEAHDRDKDLDRMREAVAEMRGALKELRSHRVERALRGGAVEELLEAPPPRPRGARRPASATSSPGASGTAAHMENEDEMVGAAMVQQALQLPTILPDPDPDRVEEAAKRMK